jgi:hypothetical protein
MKTTVEWLEHMLSIILNEEEFKKITYAIEQAKEMEKQKQGYNEEDMKEAFNGFKSGKSFIEWFEQFKNE